MRLRRAVCERSGRVMLREGVGVVAFIDGQRRAKVPSAICTLDLCESC